MPASAGGSKESAPLLSADAGSIQAEAGMVPANAAAVIPGKPRKKLEVHTAHNAVSQQGHTLAFQSECNGVMCLASAPPLFALDSEPRAPGSASDCLRVRCFGVSLPLCSHRQVVIPPAQPRCPQWPQSLDQRKCLPTVCATAACTHRWTTSDTPPDVVARAGNARHHGPGVGT